VADKIFFVMIGGDPGLLSVGLLVT